MTRVIRYCIVPYSTGLHVSSVVKPILNPSPPSPPAARTPVNDYRSLRYCSNRILRGRNHSGLQLRTCKETEAILIVLKSLTVPYKHPARLLSVRPHLDVPSIPDSPSTSLGLLSRTIHPLRYEPLPAVSVDPHRDSSPRSAHYQGRLYRTSWALRDKRQNIVSRINRLRLEWEWIAKSKSVFLMQPPINLCSIWFTVVLLNF